jgi:hypothetical protein
MLARERGSRDTIAMDPDATSAYQRLEDRASARAALIAELDQAHQELRLFERDAGFWDLDGAEFCAAVDAFLRRSQFTRATLILHDSSALAGRAVRLPAIIERFAPRLQVRETEPEIRSYALGVVIIDQSVVLRRPHFDRGFAALDRDPSAIAAAARLFDELLERSTPAPPARATGL